MPVISSGVLRSHFRGISKALGVFGLGALTLPSFAQVVPSATAVNPVSTSRERIDGDSIRPFLFHASDDALKDLRRRIAATKWPTPELVADASQGVQLATMRELASYWQTNYDWRKVEARINALPQFVTTIDGVDIHFIHVRSKHPHALPVIVTHGWPDRLSSS